MHQPPFDSTPVCRSNARNRVNDDKNVECALWRAMFFFHTFRFYPLNFASCIFFAVCHSVWFGSFVFAPRTPSSVVALASAERGCRFGNNALWLIRVWMKPNASNRILCVPTNDGLCCNNNNRRTCCMPYARDASFHCSMSHLSSHFIVCNQEFLGCVCCYCCWLRCFGGRQIKTEDLHSF